MSGSLLSRRKLYVWANRSDHSIAYLRYFRCMCGAVLSLHSHSQIIIHESFCLAECCVFFSFRDTSSRSSTITLDLDYHEHLCAGDTLYIFIYYIFYLDITSKSFSSLSSATHTTSTSPATTSTIRMDYLILVLVVKQILTVLQSYLCLASALLICQCELW